MTPSRFTYHAPGNLVNALRLVAESGDEAKVLAGGQSLIPLMKLRFASFPTIIDLSGVKELHYISVEGGSLRLGAMTTTGEVEKSGAIPDTLGALKDAVSHIADPLVRNMGTVGGNVCHADPGNDLPAVMIALSAMFVLKRERGERRVAARDFFIDSFTTAIKSGELLTEILIPLPEGNTGSSYLKQKRRAGDYSIAGVASSLTLDAKGKIAHAAVALTSLGPKVIVAAETEKFLLGKKPEISVAEEAGSVAAGEAQPSDDFYGTAEFKLNVLRRLMQESIILSAKRASAGVG